MIRGASSRCKQKKTAFRTRKSRFIFLTKSKARRLVYPSIYGLLTGCRWRDLNPSALSEGIDFMRGLKRCGASRGARVFFSMFHGSLFAPARNFLTTSTAADIALHIAGITARLPHSSLRFYCLLRCSHRSLLLPYLH